MLDNAGTIESAGTITADVTNSGTMRLAGVVAGDIVNDGSILLAGATMGIGTFSQTAAGSFDLGGFATAIGSLAGNGAVMLGAGTLTLGSDDSSTAFGGTISGIGGLTKIGTGTFTLSGANTFTGALSVDEGAAVIAAGGSITAALVNTALTTNAGVIVGDVVNSGTLISTGSITGTLDNRAGGRASLSGTMAGGIRNAGTVLLTGATTGIGAVSQDPSGVFDIGGFDTALGSLSGSGSVALGSGTITLRADNSSTRFEGVVSGTGGLIKVGSGTFTLAGVQTYGGMTEIRSGTLAIDRGQIAGSILNSANLVLDGRVLGGLTNNSASRIAGEIVGAVDNAGSITLSGDTIVRGRLSQTAGGSLALGGFRSSIGSLAGAGAIDLGAGTLTIGQDGTSATFAGAISGRGGLIKTGSGTATLTGINTFTGTTIVDAGVLANQGTLAGSVVNNAALTNSGIIAGGLLNTGGASADNSGTIRGTVQNEGRFVSSGVLGNGLANTGTATIRGTLNGDVLNTGAITLAGTTTGIRLFEQSASASFDLAGFDTTIGVVQGGGRIALGGARLTTGTDGIASQFGGTITGTGSLTKSGSGRLVLTGDNTFTGGTTIGAGVLQLGDGGTAGSLVGPIVNNGALVINRSDAFTLANLVSGSGVLVQDGTGTTTLTAANTYRGGTIVNRGRLIGNTTSLQGAILNNGTLEFAQGSAGVFAGQIGRAGVLDKTGVGLLELTGDNSAFTGRTFVRGGELRVSNTLGSLVTVQTGAVLSGNGVIGGVVAASGSTIALGANGVGMLGVAGNVQLAIGSTTSFQIRANAPSDMLIAAGNAQLGGTAAFANLGGVYAFNSNIALLAADGGRTGQFDAATGFDSFGILYRPELVYTDTQVLLRFAPNLLTNIIGTTPLTDNQRSVVNRIDAAVTEGYNPQPLFAIYALPNAAQPDAFDQLSGEVYATAAGVGIEQERLVREAVLGRLGSVAMEGRTDPALASGAGVWGQLFGGWGDGDGNGNVSPFSSERFGFVTGIDFGGADEEGSWRAGVFGMHVSSDVRIGRLGSHAEVEQSGGGVYAAITSDGWGAAVGGYLTAIDLAASRQIALPGFAELNQGVGEGSARQVFAEWSYSVTSGSSTLRPFIAASLGSFKLDGLTEVGGASALRVERQRYDTASATAGLDGAVRVGKSLRLAGTLAGRAQIGDRAPQAQIALAAAPQQTFGIDGVQLDDFALAARLDATLELGPNVDVSVGYTGLIGNTVQDHGARATLQIAF